MRLQCPTKVIGSSTPVMPDSAPNAEIVHLVYPERKKPKDIKINLPEVQVSWYDGGLKLRSLKIGRPPETQAQVVFSMELKTHITAGRVGVNTAFFPAGALAVLQRCAV